MDENEEIQKWMKYLEVYGGGIYGTFTCGKRGQDMVAAGPGRAK